MNASYPLSSPLSFGIDVGKDFLDVNAYPSTAALRVSNDAAGVEKLLAHLRRHNVTRVVIEATGGYQRRCVHALQAAQIPVSVVNPRQVRDYAKALGVLAKTDRIDARILARFGHDLAPAPTPVPTERQTQREAWVARRAQLLQMRTAELNRRQQTDDPLAAKSIDAVLELFDKQIAQLDQAIELSIAQDPEALAVEKQLRKVQGVGPVVSRSLIAELPELGKVGRGRIAALVGLAPYNDDSGKFNGKRAIRGGRFRIRCVLYMAALTARRVNPAIRAYYQRLRTAGKPFKVAMVACMRKVLVYLNEQVRKLTAQPTPA